jgi:hypothetical protein
MPKNNQYIDKYAANAALHNRSAHPERAPN